MNEAMTLSLIISTTTVVVASVASIALVGICRRLTVLIHLMRTQSATNTAVYENAHTENMHVQVSLMTDEQRVMFQALLDGDDS